MRYAVEGPDGAQPCMNDPVSRVGTLDVVFMITLGVILLLIGGLLSIPALWILGMILALVGGMLWLLGATDHKVGPRRHDW